MLAQMSYPAAPPRIEKLQRNEPFTPNLTFNESLEAIASFLPHLRNLQSAMIRKAKGVVRFLSWPCSSARNHVLHLEYHATAYT